MELADLFAAAAVIGDRYLTEEEIAERDRELAEAVEAAEKAIAETVG